MKQYNVNGKPVKIWTSEEINFLKENFPHKGIEFCSQALQTPYKTVKWKVDRLKLCKIYPERIDMNKIFTPNGVYLLGFLWADGHVHKRAYDISCTVSIKDGPCLRNIFNSIGTWHIRDFKLKRGQTYTRFAIYSKALHSFLRENDYFDKSLVAPTKILSLIPENLKHYFWRGFLDGDGCFYVSKHNKKQLTLAGSVDMDWTEAEKLFNKMNAKYRIERRKMNNGSGSMFTTSDSLSLLKFGQYIYKNYKQDKIGLERKYLKFLKILDLILNRFTRSKGFRKMHGYYYIFLTFNRKKKTVARFSNENDIQKEKEKVLQKYRPEIYELMLLSRELTSSI